MKSIQASTIQASDDDATIYTKLQRWCEDGCSVSFVRTYDGVGRVEYCVTKGATAAEMRTLLREEISDAVAVIMPEQS